MTVGISNNTNNSKYFAKQPTSSVATPVVPIHQNNNKNNKVRNTVIAVGGVSLLALAIFKGKSIAKSVSKLFKNDAKEIESQKFNNLEEETEIAESVSKQKTEEIQNKEIHVKKEASDKEENYIDLSKYKYESESNELFDNKTILETIKEDLDPKLNATPYIIKKDIHGRDVIKVKTKTGDYAYVILEDEVKEFVQENNVTSDELYEIGHFVQQKRLNKYLGNSQNELENMSIWQYLNKYRAERDKEIKIIDTPNNKPINSETHQKSSSQEPGFWANDSTNRNRRQNNEEDGFWDDLAAGMSDF